MTTFEVQKTGVILPHKLKKEINSNGTIATVLNHIVFNEPSDIRLHFQGSGPLPGGEETELDSLIAAHDATPEDPRNGTIDNDGDQQVRIKEAKKGWHIQPHFVDMVTSQIGQTLGEFDQDLTPLGWSTLKFYKLVDDVLTETSDTSDQDQIVATILDFAPPWDYEVNGGEIKVLKTPTDLCCLFPVAVPDIPAPIGNKLFATGGIDLRFIEKGQTEQIKSLASKFMSYQAEGVPDGWVNKIRLHLRHHPGIMVPIQFKFSLLAE